MVVVSNFKKTGKPVESEVLVAPVSPVLAEFNALEARGDDKPQPGGDEAGSDATPTSQVEHGSLEGYSPSEQAAGVAMSASSGGNSPGGGDIGDAGIRPQGQWNKVVRTDRLLRERESEQST